MKASQMHRHDRGAIFAGFKWPSLDWPSLDWPNVALPSVDRQAVSLAGRHGSWPRTLSVCVVAAAVVLAVGAQDASAATQAKRRSDAEFGAPKTGQRATSRAAPGSGVRLARSEPKAADGRTAGLTSVTATSAVPVPPAPLLGIVSIGSQHIDVYGPAGAIARSRVSTGTASNPTPTGVFSILQRNRYHESNIYSNAPMPFMQRLTWSGIALHEGNVPNYPASHGCIRLPAQFAQSMWGIGRIGMRVIISPVDVRPQAFAHARLPVPLAKPATRSAELVQLAATGQTPPPVEPARALRPYEAAHARVAKATADKAAADKAVKPAHDFAARKSAEASQATAALKASAGILADADEHLEFENLAMVTVQTPASEALMLERIRIAEAGVKAARDAHDKLKEIERSIVDQSFAAASAAREAREAVEATADELRDARRALEPVAIFVSRKTGRLYVRQGFQPLLDEPVVIADADRPLGTHVFTAVDEVGDGQRLAWQAVSVPTTGGDPPRRQNGGAASGAERHASTAAEALERFELPEAVRSLVSERLWPGASLIFSDYGLGETGQGTDFVILTK